MINLFRNIIFACGMLSFGLIFMSNISSVKREVVFTYNRLMIGGGPDGFEKTFAGSFPTYIQINGEQILQSVHVQINCEGKGQNECPSLLSIGPDNLNGELLAPAFLSSIENTLINIESTIENGSNNGNQSGTIVLPDGTAYPYSITWVTNSTGAIEINLTVYDN